MSLSKLLSDVLKDPPQVSAQHEIEVLQELPVQTLYFALKEADSDMALWFAENARISQFQGLLDLDCWSGDRFEPTRFMNFFHLLARCSPQRMRLLSRELDPELIVRSLMEFCEVIDFDATEPPMIPEEQLLISPDNRYAIILKEDDPNLRESLMLWLDKLSATDLDLMRRHLESCKWEQPSDLEEFAYGIKKGRLEDHGFVDRAEAISLYAQGSAPSLKTDLLASPLPEKAKEEASAVSPSLDGNFIPEVIRAPLSESNFFAEGLSKLEDDKVKEVLVLESLRTMNMAIMADDLIHASVDAIKEATSRTRKYLDLGLFYLSEGKVENCVQHLVTQPLVQVTRLGWLLTRDLVKAADVLRSKYPSQIWGLSDGFLIQKLSGRHPELFESELKALGSSSKDFISLESITKCASRLATLGALQQFVSEKLEGVLELQTQVLGPTESLYSRVLTGMVHQLLGSEFSVRPLAPKDWELLTERFDRKALQSFIEVFVKRAPEAAQFHLELRLQETLDELETYLRNSQEFPKPHLFSALRLESKGNPFLKPEQGNGAHA